MKASQLLARIRVVGGEVKISRAGKLTGRNIPADLKAQLCRDAYLVKALLREQQAEKAWEASGRDPRWWCNYQQLGDRDTRRLHLQREALLNSSSRCSEIFGTRPTRARITIS